MRTSGTRTSGTLARGAALACLVAVAGCRSGSNAAPPLATPAASAEAKGAPASGAMSLPTLKVLLDDPRLASARAFERSKDWAAAAKAVHDAHPLDLPPPEACAWDYLEGRLFVAANATTEAIAAFERAEAAICPLAGHAKLRSAQAIARSGRADEAIARARAVPSDHTSLKDDVKMVLAESHAAKGDRAGALPLWRAWLAANPYGSRWVDTSVRIASALLDGVDGPADARAKEAYDAATRVVIEAPRLADSSGATQARTRAVALLRAKDRTVTEALSDVERARQAQGWLDASEPTRAFDLASAVLKGPSGAASCKAALTRAYASAKKSPKVDTWADAVSACEKDAELVTALFAGAKARTGKDPKLAIEWFGKVEALFPNHRLADDARFRAALLVAQGTDEDREDRSEQMLWTLPDAYPSGDMRTEALFRVVLAQLQKGRVEDWEAVKPVLDRIVELTPEDRHWATAGRAEYFRARAAAMTGDGEGAVRRWDHVVEQHPLSFYMLLSYARLSELDPARAKRVLDGAALRDREPTAPELRAFPSKAHPVLEAPAVTRAMRLLEVGDVDAARRELAASGAVAEAADPEVIWTVGALYNQAGLFELGHAFSRGRVTDHLEHYPEGKWRVPWETAYPRAYAPLVATTCAKYTLPQPITWGVMREESSFIADVKSHANAYGLMQLIIPTAKGVAVGTGYGSDEDSLRRPEVSIELGTKLLASLRKKHGHDALAIGAYNGGSGAVNRWMTGRTSDELDLFVENVPWEETRNYIKRVLSSVAAYGYLYDRKAFDDALGIPLRLGR
ncbi:MAG: lytic transglycosylase domain-containing protein [Labilithrix sp.]|nr:lytic transglycosylase domain-containing protein [Labilithrix sp.]